MGQAEPAEPTYTHADLTEAHTKGYKLGMAQVQAEDATRANGNAVLVPADKLAELQAEAGRYRLLRSIASMESVDHSRVITAEFYVGPLEGRDVDMDEDIDVVIKAEAERKSAAAGERQS
jgi:hypothetical protein